MKHTKQVKPPFIGISAGLLTIETGCFMGRERIFVGHDYIQAVSEAGGIPIILPILKEKAQIDRQLDYMDGLLLSGGCDVNPLEYQEEPQPALEFTCPERDFYELELIRMAYRQGKPILGICRGHQLLNVAFGGTLYQDIHSMFPSSLQHSQKSKPDVAIHTIELVEGTILQQLMGAKSLGVNSHHHQAVKNLASGFIVNAWAKDGVIEGIEKMDETFIVGVQWHPELMLSKHLKMLKLFQSFIEACALPRKPL